MKAIVDLAKRMLGIKSPSELYLREDERCVCCGQYVPEGRQVCLSCEKKELCRRCTYQHTLDCPNSALCYSRPDKPYYEEK